MNLLLIKQISILSALAGAAVGIIGMIPFIGGIAFLLMFLALAAFVLVFMKQKNMIGILDYKESAIYGAISGFVSFIAFSVVYIPVSSLIGLIFKTVSFGILRSFFTSFISFVVMIMLVFFIAILAALMNAFAGVVTAYVYEILSGFKKQENENIDFEIR
ncbi:hypothetical protein IJI31_02835 [bacterium]|nr:hypothetical protein [bacterium]